MDAQSNEIKSEAEANKSRTQWSPFRKQIEQRYASVVRGIDALRAVVDGYSQDELTPDVRRDIYSEADDLLALLGDRRHPLDRLWASFKNGVFAEDTTSQLISDRLAAIARAIQARRAALVGEKAAPQLPSEAALLAAVTEKFYASWAFKGIAAALVAAIALAAGGNFILFDQSLKLSENLDHEYDKSKTALHDTLTAAQTSLNSQSDLIKTATAAVTKQSEEASKSIQKLQDEFKQGSIDKIIADLKQDLDKGTGPLTAKINAASSQLDQDLSALKLDDKLKAIGDKLNPATSAVADMEATLQTLQAKLAELQPRIAPLAGQIDAANAQSAQIVAAGATAASAATAAKTSEAAARDAETEAGARRDRIASQLDGVSNNLGPQQTSLAAVTASVASLRQEVDSAQRSLGGVTHDISTLVAMQGSLDALAKRVAALEQPKPPQQPLPPDSHPARTEELLNGDERCAIQSKLNAIGPSVGDVDGTLGTKSHAAIQAWQRTHQYNDNGHLTPDQINELIGTGPVPACPPKPPPNPASTKRPPHGTAHSRQADSGGEPYSSAASLAA